MAVVFRNIDSGGGATGVFQFNTNSITPVPNKLYFLTVATKIDTTMPNTPTVSGCGLTWVQVAVSAITDSQRIKLTMFRAMGASPSSGVLTVDFALQNQQRVAWIIDEMDNIDITGSNGANAVVQSATATVASISSSASVNLATFAKNDNATYGAFANIDTPITPGSGFTEIVEADGSEMRLQTQYSLLPMTTVNWTFSGDYGCCAATELSHVGKGGAFLYNII